MHTTNYSRDPRRKPPAYVVLDSDDEDVSLQPAVSHTQQISHEQPGDVISISDDENDSPEAPVSNNSAISSAISTLVPVLPQPPPAMLLPNEPAFSTTSSSTQLVAPIQAYQELSQALEAFNMSQATLRPTIEDSVPRPSAGHSSEHSVTSLLDLAQQDVDVKQMQTPLSGTISIDSESDFEQDDDFDQDYNYEADYLLGGPLEMPHVTTRVAPKNTDYAHLMNKSYHDSRSRKLSYQYHLENKRTQAEFHPDAVKRPRIELPAGVTSMELDRIVNQVCDFSSRMLPVDWQHVANDVFKYTGYRRSGRECLEAFEKAIGQYQKMPRQPVPSWMSMQSKISVRNLLGMRELGSKRTALIKDHLLLHMTRSYRLATSFNFSSGSVVDMALKTSTMKLAIANVATQDSYNRKGNLLLCDLDKGTTKKLEGHTRFDETLNQEMEVTVNDIKLSYSKNFFISGSDDHKTMIWNAETGALMNTIGEHTSRVTRIAILEHSQDGQDVFATSSADGSVNIYGLDDEGQICVSNKTLISRSGGKRCISSISFGYYHFWDCLAAGFEGTDSQRGGSDGLQGQVAFYDANTMQKVQAGDLGYRLGSARPTQKSVSCLSFAPSGTQLVCGTSGRASAADDEKGDGFIRVFDVKRSKEVLHAESGHDDVNLVDFSPCERYLISGSDSNEIAVFDRRNLNRALHRLEHSVRMDDQDHAGITSALWWPSSHGSSQTMLITGGGDETVKLWDIRRAPEETEIWSVETNIGPIARMIAPPTMEYLVVGSDPGAVNIFTIDDGMIVKYKNKSMALLNEDEA
ncbi:hypothetical protein BGX23_003339 [Mortierella sp. AD031]|nr:hypothetical protein BGX23_003339 [Mortierella sp. AD031]KAG0200322.1 hypothetical protein BGX33_011067 [Mortierella sp. NVP41]